MSSMQRDIERILIPHDAIARRVRDLAAQITADHVAGAGAGAGATGGDADDAEVTIVPILTGAMIFCGDLIRHLPLRMRIGLMTVSSYPGRSTQAQGSRVLGEQLGDLTGRHVLLVDDILDSGGTIRTVVPLVRELGPASVKTCVLLRKDRPAARQTKVDYVGFDIPDEFVVGYGLDYNDYYRNLPDIVTLRQDVIDSGGGTATTTTGGAA